MRVRPRRLNLGGKAEAAATGHEEAQASATGQEKKFASQRESRGASLQWSASKSQTTWEQRLFLGGYSTKTMDVIGRGEDALHSPCGRRPIVACTNSKQDDDDTRLIGGIWRGVA